MKGNLRLERKGYSKMAAHMMIRWPLVMHVGINEIAISLFGFYFVENVSMHERKNCDIFVRKILQKVS